MPESEFLTFMLAGEEYGISILAVQEIRAWSAVTDMPNTPDYVKGIIHLRGTIVPIIDLRERFNKPAVTYDQNTVIIVLKQSIEGKESVIGIVVDAVSDVYKFSTSEMKVPPDFGADSHNGFVDGMATVDNRIIILLAAKRLLNTEELYQIAHQMQSVSALNRC